MTWRTEADHPDAGGDELVASATGWPDHFGPPTPMRWARAVMAGVHTAVGDRRWALDPSSLRLTEAWVSGGPGVAAPSAALLSVEVTLVQIVDLGPWTALRLDLVVTDPDGATSATAAATVAGTGAGLGGGTRPQGAETPGGPPGRERTESPIWRSSADAEPGAVAAFTRWSRDHTPIHSDLRAARAAGFPRLVAPGMFVLALLSTAAARAAGGGVRSVGARFVRPTLVGDTLAVDVRLDTGSRVAMRAKGPAGDVVRRAWAQLA